MLDVIALSFLRQSLLHLATAFSWDNGSRVSYSGLEMSRHVWRLQMYIVPSVVCSVYISVFSCNKAVCCVCM